jgi:nucleotide-binding universal stress UspA family protein
MTALAAHSPAAAHPDGSQPADAAPTQGTAPIIAAVDGSSASRYAVDTAVRLAIELNAALTFVYVRRGPPGFLGTPVYQRRLTAKMSRAHRVLARALRAASQAGVEADGEILEGSPRKRILEFARDRGARLIVVGSRRRKFGRSVSCAIVRAAKRPVVVAPDGTASSARETRSEDLVVGGRSE